MPEKKKSRADHFRAAGEAARRGKRGGEPRRKQPLLFGVEALGVMYGDLGTNTLFVIHIAFSGSERIAPNPENVLGIVSLIFWTLVVTISVKYRLYVMRADNEGKGASWR